MTKGARKLEVGEVITVVFPLPERSLSSNARNAHWKDSSVDKARLRATVNASARQAFGKAGIFGPGPHAGKVEVSSEWFCGRVLPEDLYYRPQDVPNAIDALKAAYDGLVDAGLTRTDRAKHLDVGTTRFHGEKASGRRMEVVLTIRILEDAASVARETVKHRRRK